MDTLNSELTVLTKLDGLRREAHHLTRLGKESLKKVQSNQQVDAKDWHTSEDLNEAALLVSIQAHRYLGSVEHEAEASKELVDKLRNISLANDLFTSEVKDNDWLIAAQVPVLTTARVMQALVATSRNAFSTASLLCYYRIVREIQSVDSPHWTIGGAKAGRSGDPTAFVTGECIRAILLFERALRRTATFFGHTYNLYKEMNRLKKLDNKKLPGVEHWQDSEIERTGLAWFTSSDVLLGGIALNLEREPHEGRIDRHYLRAFLDKLSGKQRGENDLKSEIKRAEREFRVASKDIEEYRAQELSAAEASMPQDEGRKLQRYRRSQSAHLLAHSVVEQAMREAEKALTYCGGNDRTLENLRELSRLFENIANRVYKVVEPAKRFVETVLNRELAAASVGKKIAWDGRELVFAAAAYGAATKWNPSERLTRACILLSKSVSEKGTLPAGRPFHLTRHGLTLHPIAFETTRCFAQLLQHVEVPVRPKLVQRMFYLLREHKCSVGKNSQGSQCGWSYEDPLVPTKPSLWVTALAVLALNRIARMLDHKINAVVFKNFDVKIPNKNLTGPGLENLVYPDYGLRLAPETIKSRLERKTSVSILLEQMRAHIMRAKLPKHYSKPPFSTLFYGPPGTGKTTFLEALAFSSNVHLVQVTPGDIVVAGQELVESRARAIFEALSMLNKAVIILDEFEPILFNREKVRGGTNIFSFVTPAMLPKLKKLHDAAKHQSLAFCLVTNRYEELDKAAIRKGRFDHHVGIYNMDPLSRAGAFLNKIFAERENLTDAQYRRFEEVIRLSAVVQVEEFVKEWLRASKDGDELWEEIPYAYILKDAQQFKEWPNYTRAEELCKGYGEDNTGCLSDDLERWLLQIELILMKQGLEKALVDPSGSIL